MMTYSKFNMKVAGDGREQYEEINTTCGFLTVENYIRKCLTDTQEYDLSSIFEGIYQVKEKVISSYRQELLYLNKTFVDLS